ncbi:MAG: S41 family peptidase [Pirellulaceae bacterium]
MILVNLKKFCCGALLSGLALIAQPAVGQDASLKSTLTATNVAEQIVLRGQEYEQQGMWADALSLYQQALKTSPNDQSLLKRRNLARIHYDLGRRNADSSFVDQVKRTDARIAEGIYSEVLLKVQAYYVDEPDWHQIAQFGLTSLKVALESEEFRSSHLQGQSLDGIAAAFTKLADSLRNTSVRQRSDANWVASHAASELKKSINLQPSATYFEFICGAISALDPYSAFLSDNQYAETMSQIEGNFVGLGVELKTLSETLELVSVIPGGPAEKGGLRAGDHIIAVDSSSVQEFGSEKVADLLRGEEGSYVRVAFVRGNDQPRTLLLQRRRVEIPSVDGVAMVDELNGVGYIRLTNFQKTTVRDFDAALWQLQRQGMRSLIIDLRGNPGGLLTASVEIADRFVGSGVIVATKGRNPLEDFTHRAQLAGTWRMPVAILVDENSASASEILAAAIREHQRGTIVGTQSYGKGSVQGIFPLNISGGGVRLTTAKFYGPSGNSVNQVGVKPDVAIQTVAKPAVDGQNSNESDTALQTAIRLVRQNNQLSSK